MKEERNTMTDTASTSAELVFDANSNMINKHYQDTSVNENTVGYCSFSSSNKRNSESKTMINNKRKLEKTSAIKDLLDEVGILANDFGSEEDEEEKKIKAAKKLLFPETIATSFLEVSDVLRSERRQEFCPIYDDETSEQIALRQAKRRPVGSLLSKRIRWDDLKRKRQEEERRTAQTQIQYGPYGNVYYNAQLFDNSNNDYYPTISSQYANMLEINRAQQEHSGFWPEYQQMREQVHTCPYSNMYSNNNMMVIKSNPPPSYSLINHDGQLKHWTQPSLPSSKPYSY